MGRERESKTRDVARDAARRRAEESTHGGAGWSVNLPEGVKFLENDGKTIELDFVPYRISSPQNPDVLAGRAKVGQLIDARMFKIHRNIGIEQKQYICLTSIGQRCPICEAYVSAKKEGRLDKEELDALRAKERMLYNVIDVNDKDGKIMIWDVSYHLFTKQLEHEQEERNEYYDYWLPDGGYTLRIRFEKRTIGRSDPFWEADRIDFTKREPLSDRDLDDAVDLDAALNVLDYKKLEKIFLGVDDDPEKENAPDNKPEERREGRRGRSDEKEKTEPASTTRGGRGSEDRSIHDRSPDAPGERERSERDRGERDRGRHAVDPEQDCPGGGKFGEDIDKLDKCDTCDKWKPCRDESKKPKEADSKNEPPKRRR